MSDGNVIRFPGPKAIAANKPPEIPADAAPPEAIRELEELGKHVTSLTNAQVKALHMIFSDQAFVCISMSPDGEGGGADIRTVVGGDREIVRSVANGAGQGLHGVLSRLLDREDLL